MLWNCVLRYASRETVNVVYATDSAAFRAKLSGSNSDKHKGKQITVCEHCKKP